MLSFLGLRGSHILVDYVHGDRKARAMSIPYTGKRMKLKLGLEGYKPCKEFVPSSRRTSWLLSSANLLDFNSQFNQSADLLSALSNTFLVSRLFEAIIEATEPADPGSRYRFKGRLVSLEWINIIGNATIIDRSNVLIAMPIAGLILMREYTLALGPRTWKNWY